MGHQEKNLELLSLISMTNNPDWFLWKIGCYGLRRGIELKWQGRSPGLDKGLNVQSSEQDMRVWYVNYFWEADGQHKAYKISHAFVCQFWLHFFLVFSPIPRKPQLGEILVVETPHDFESL